MTKKTLKKEYQPGGSKRHVILEKAVEYLKDPRVGLQGDKMHFLMEELGLSQSEYLTCLNDAAGGDYWQSQNAVQNDSKNHSKLERRGKLQAASSKPEKKI